MNRCIVLVSSKFVSGISAQVGFCKFSGNFICHESIGLKKNNNDFIHFSVLRKIAYL